MLLLQWFPYQTIDKFWNPFYDIYVCIVNQPHFQLGGNLEFRHTRKSKVYFLWIIWSYDVRGLNQKMIIFFFSDKEKDIFATYWYENGRKHLKESIFILFFYGWDKYLRTLGAKCEIESVRPAQ